MSASESGQFATGWTPLRTVLECVSRFQADPELRAFLAELEEEPDPLH